MRVQALALQGLGFRVWVQGSGFRVSQLRVMSIAACGAGWFCRASVYIRP